MKKLWNILVLTLALNFLALAGGAGYLYQTGRLDKEKVHAIREILFPPAAEAAGSPTTQPTTQPSAEQPARQLQDLLAANANLPAAEQVQLLQRTFDSRIAQLDRRQREIETLHDLVKNAEAQLSRERAAFEQQRAALEAREQEQARLAEDEGFQSALQLYKTMRPKQVKDVFATLSDDVVVRYLRAMEPRKSAQVLGEFKTPAELERVKLWMERIRQAEAAASASNP